MNAFGSHICSELQPDPAAARNTECTNQRMPDSSGQSAEGRPRLRRLGTAAGAPNGHLWSSIEAPPMAAGQLVPPPRRANGTVETAEDKFTTTEETAASISAL